METGLNSLKSGLMLGFFLIDIDKNKKFYDIIKIILNYAWLSRYEIL